MIFTECYEVISFPTSGNSLLVGESEGFALIEDGRVFGVVSGGVAGVRFAGLEVGWVEEDFFSNIHCTSLVN